MILPTTSPAPHHPRTLALALTAAAALALSGCGAQEDVSFTCGPEEEPRACGWWEARRANAAFEEVEDRFMITRDYMNAALMDPAGEHDWDGLAEYATDPYFTEIRNLTADFSEAGQYLDKEIPITRIERLRYDKDRLVIAACGDASGVAAKHMGTDEFSRFGDITRLEIEAIKRSDEWVIESAWNAEADGCADAG